MLGPEAFIPFAERNRLIQPITAWALSRAVDQVAALPAGESHPLPVAVNISTKLFEQDSLIDTLERVCGRSPQPSSPLVLEITEGALTEYEHAAEVLTEIRRLGIRVAIDDFGMGYSSLSRLKGLPVDVLKVDRSFVGNLPSGGADRAITDAIVRLAASLGMETVAEGVETADQLQAVADLGCSQAQGYLFAVPMTIGEVPAWLGRWRLWEGPRLLDRTAKAVRANLPASADAARRLSLAG